MRYIDFETYANEMVQRDNLLEPFIMAFNSIRKTIKDSHKSNLICKEFQEEIAKRYEGDIFMTEDIINVILGFKSPPGQNYLNQGYWSFNRKYPCFGAPWVDLAFNESSKDIYFKIRCKGSFCDIEAPPYWIHFILNTNKYHSYEELDYIFSNYNTIDYWWIFNNKKIVGKFAIDVKS